jgi:DNA-binding transcriptional MerR regulator
MPINDQRPTYNLKAVVRETGLKPDTLRAWERRYGVPAPDRTDSGHRLYSQRDIDTLKWLLERQNEGMSISRAIELWHRLEAAGNDPLDMNVSPGTQKNSDNRSTLAATDRSPLAESDTVTRLRDSWVNACMSFDEQGAEHLLSQAFALFPAEVVCLDLIQRGLASIGDGWYKGKVTVQQEHFASALALRRMEALLISTPAPTRPGRILVGCPPEEEHTFVPLLVSLLLRRRGWDVVYLGANIPLRSLEATLNAVRPNLVVMTAQQLPTAASLMEMAEVLYRERVPVAFGGLIFTQVAELHTAIPGYYLGGKIEGATAEIERLMSSLRPIPAQRLVTYDYKEALDHFRARQAKIEAALTLGNIDFLDPDIEWIEGLLVYHNQMPPEALDNYLETYRAAAIRHLERPGYLVINWLSRLLGHDLPAGLQQFVTSQPNKSQ